MTDGDADTSVVADCVSEPKDDAVGDPECDNDVLALKYMVTGGPTEAFADAVGEPPLKPPTPIAPGDVVGRSDILDEMVDLAVADLVRVAGFVGSPVGSVEGDLNGDRDADEQGDADLLNDGLAVDEPVKDWLPAAETLNCDDALSDESVVGEPLLENDTLEERQRVAVPLDDGVKVTVLLADTVKVDDALRVVLPQLDAVCVPLRVTVAHEDDEFRGDTLGGRVELGRAEPLGNSVMLGELLRHIDAVEEPETLEEPVKVIVDVDAFDTASLRGAARRSTSSKTRPPPPPPAPPPAMPPPPPPPPAPLAGATPVASTLKSVASDTVKFAVASAEYT